MICKCGAVLDNHSTRCEECRSFSDERLSEQIIDSKSKRQSRFDREAFELIIQEG